jgi:hypothetical protein
MMPTRPTRISRSTPSAMTRTTSPATTNRA